MQEIKALKQKTPDTCGFASVRSLFRLYKVNVTEEELIRNSNITYNFLKEWGARHTHLRKICRQYGFSFYSKYNASVKDVEKWIDREIPVLIDYWDVNDGHYSVLYKYDKEYFYFADPFNFKKGDTKRTVDPKKISRSEFLSNWVDYDINKKKIKKWFAVIKPRNNK